MRGTILESRAATLRTAIYLRTDLEPSTFVVLLAYERHSVQTGVIANVAELTEVLARSLAISDQLEAVTTMVRMLANEVEPSNRPNREVAESTSKIMREATDVPFRAPALVEAISSKMRTVREVRRIPDSTEELRGNSE